MKRLFIAVDLAIPVVERLAVLQRQLDERLDGGVRIKWTRPQNIHMTLKFLGDTDEAMVPMLRDVLSNLVGPLFPFEVESRGIGCFPRPDNPRIIWAGFDDDGAEVLSLLQQALERDLDELGIPKDQRAFKPHVTLGRVKSRQKPSLDHLFQGLRGTSWGNSYIKDFILFESRLDHTGATYHVLDRFPLGS
jgi:2'-5' RNA ligase